MATWYVNTDVVGGTDDGTALANAWGTIADALAYFATLGSGAASEDHTINLRASSGTTDALASYVTYTISYFYGTAYTLTIVPESGDEVIKTGIDANRYRVSGYGFRINISGLLLDSVQFTFANDTQIYLGDYGTSAHEVRNCYFVESAATVNRALFVGVNNAASAVSIHDNIFNFTGTTLYAGIEVGAIPADITIYNNVIEGQTAASGGIYITSGYSGDITIKNNAFPNCDDDINDAGATGAVVVQYNAATDDLDTEFTETTNIQPTNWANEFADYPNGDYTPQTGYDLEDAGVGPATDATVSTTDIDGTSRSGTTCDIGAAEIAAGGAGKPAIYFQQMAHAAGM